MTEEKTKIISYKELISEKFMRLNILEEHISKNLRDIKRVHKELLELIKDYKDSNDRF